MRIDERAHARCAAETDRTTDVWGRRTPHDILTSWPVRVDTQFAEGIEEADVDRWVQSACVLCSNGCGCDIAVKDGRMVGIRGRADDSINRGRLGPKGLLASWQGMDNPDRLTQPLIRRNGELQPASWDEAMQAIVERSSSLLESAGPLSHGFYTSGQLFLEEYYALAVIGKAGIGTPHMDGNTRLCTATAATALKETFGADGQPGCYEDIDDCDALFLFGHNMAATQTVLWARVLDRLDGEHPPKLVVVDPRMTPVARRADVHLPVLPGTNLALMHALVNELLTHGWVDDAFIAEHTIGLDEVRSVVAEWTPERAAETCGVSADDIRRAAEIFGTSTRVLSTVLQGFYQAAQATASACQVNNLHLLRGMIGREGCGILQMNGQPTAQNNRECGADGDLPGFRNWDNPDHVAELAKLWGVDDLVIPHWAPPTHAMQLFRYAEQGSIRFLWISATNPAVSLPELRRIREILARAELFVVVQDLYLTETARLADVVLPAAGWGEKTGTFTNATRTVHLSEKAVDPPGDARSDFDIFLDYAARMGFRRDDGRPLLDWTDPEDAYRAWQDCSRGRPCDYTGISYDDLRARSGIRWPRTEGQVASVDRLYADADFPSRPDYCESYGHDLLTGASRTAEQFRASAPNGRAILKTAEYTGPHEPPDSEYPFRFTTGRSTFHFHTRTKTAHSPELDARAPEVWVELAEADARAAGLVDGEMVRVSSRRGSIVAELRITGIRSGTVFAPFHYGYWDAPEGAETRHPTAANELTITEWDPVSKQPVFKTAAVRVERLEESS
ncbi:MULTISPECIES: molybdopterin oxidoreductase family protein [unclassified Leifsonia]|uniref:molybdopterin oxidoreductase family protein n=1 Tax=unclassified Leifsonia TaxID=2663824 RepID=UPI00070232FF|nr:MULTISPECIES: nitrate reductase [unclassified Leifsonia]KQX05567.1 molybdopterin oxidoreductase [Leifsonia sp. Root1293]KRA09201.1 molybdopterin oxidoreductase [Leifsonia sp. Root60]